MDVNCFLRGRVWKKRRIPVLGAVAILTLLVLSPGEIWAAGLQENMPVQLYALWNEFPQIDVQDRYVSIEEIAAGKITEEELLEKITVTDKEDGVGENHLLQNTEEQKFITIPDFSEEELRAFCHNGSVSMTIRAEDSCGCVTCQKFTVYVVDTQGKDVQQAQVRFISGQYLDTLADGSIWQEEADYRTLLQEAVSAEKEAEQTCLFSAQQVQEAKAYLAENGFADGGAADSLDRFYRQFFVS